MPVVPRKAPSLLRVPVVTTVLVALAVAGLLATIWVAASPKLVSAADLREFNPGNIISDQVFFDSGSMSPAGVQAFLADKGSACVRGADGSACLHSYTQATTSRAATSYCPTGYQGAGQESAAMIIYKVAQACGINPQVLLVKLQKEMGFIRTTNPTAKMYERAMGYACPDNGTGQCDPAYAGLQNQLYRAASQFQRYVQEPTRYAYRAGITNFILYHPYNDCGRQSVYIQNGATAALYNYTPYVPDAAALAAGYGNGGRCSSYGNRNFFSYFTDWFGSTQSTGSGAINLKYVSMGGSASYLGAPVAATSCDLHGGGCGRAYQNGSIYWSSSSGAAVVDGEVRAGWWATGGVSGTLGYPIADVGPIPGGSAGAFQGGSVYSSAATGPQAVGRELLTTWWNTGGVNGPLGWPTAHSGAVPGGGTGGAFQGGSVYWSAGTGAHWLTGDVRLKWWNTGGTTGVLGFPTADLVSVAGGTGARFQGGSIYSSPSTGARTVRGVDADWLARGGPAGSLGFPTADTAEVTGGGGFAGLVSKFTGGTLYTSSVTKPALLSGDMLTAYEAAGGPALYGFPLADQGPVPGGAAAALQYAGLYSSPGTGAHLVWGASRTAWGARGGFSGPLGFPTADTAEVTGGGGVAGLVGEFAGGTLYTSTATKPAVLSGNVLAAYEAAGGPALYGFPVADQTAVTGGEVVGLQYATVYSSPGTGAHLVWGASRAAWWARGELASPLGFPTSDTTVVTGGGGFAGLVTEFTGGALYTSGVTKPAVLSGTLLTAYKAAGGPALFGFPLADQAAVTGGQVAGLQYATVYSSPGTGAHVVWGAGRQAWWASGELAGPLGFPTSGTTERTVNGVTGTVTSFQHGSVYSSPSTGGRVVLSAVDSQYRTAGGPASSYGWPTSNTYAVTGGVRNDFQSGQITG